MLIAPQSPIGQEGNLSASCCKIAITPTTKVSGRMVGHSETRNGGEGGILGIVAEPCLALHRLVVLPSSNPQKILNLAPC